jgi:lipopolysaccharide biosynthesis glycosyltransferase
METDMDPFPYWIGYDGRERDAFDVASFSCQRKSTISLYIRALKHKEMRAAGFFNREWTVNKDGTTIDVLDGRPFSTEFAFTRFLVPALQRYQGWALFTDCDVLWVDNIASLYSAADDQYAVMVVKNTHVPTNVRKIDSQVQQAYPRKNWSSVVLWNCGHPDNRALTPEVVNTAKGSFLHGFEWLPDNKIGALEPGWNYLVGHSSRKVKPRLLHYTDGGPWFDHMKNVPFAGWWTNEYDHMMRVKGRFD